jgi:hypothetical protein
MDDNGNELAFTANPRRTPVDEIAPPLGATDGKRLGEELPVFCERCGYSLHGLPQTRCQQCRVLHFSCPECGHHQPINTLRPAFQRMLGRLRAMGLALILFLKINFFFWCLFAWAALGTEIAYTYRYYGPGQARQNVTAVYHTEGGMIIFLFAAAFAAVGRMLLLRWRRGLLIGVTIASLVVLALMIGAHLEQSWYYEPLPSPMTFEFILYLMCAFTGACIGGAVVWGIWLALAHAFLPKKTSAALIEWQRAMSEDHRTVNVAADERG